MAAIGLFVQLLPLALGAALSPSLLVLQLALLTRRGDALGRAWALAAGRMLSLAVITVGGTSLLARLPDFGRGWRASQAAGVILLVAGVVLVALAWRERRRGPRATPTGRLDRFLDAPPATLFVFGAAWMFVNASTLALYVPAMHVVSRAEVDWAVRAVALVFLFLAASAAALVPPLMVSLEGPSVRPQLARVQRWMTDNGHRITIGVTLVFGIVLAAVGVGNLLGATWATGTAAAGT